MFLHQPGEAGWHGINVGFFEGRFHLFTTHGALTTERTILHAVSDDGVTWQRRPDIEAMGKPGAFDGFTIYDLQIFAHDGRYYLYYTGLDAPGDQNQKQAIGLLTSDDLETWTKYSDAPLHEASGVHYEPFVPDEATYQEKDRGRQWYRDPWVVALPNGTFGMSVGARAAGGHRDVAGCLSWATSDDLIHWESKPPLHHPGRFHTMECPAIFNLDGRSYLIWLTHPEWGTPLVTTDPWQQAGVFYGVSDGGAEGPYRQPHDEILIGGAYTHPKGRRRGRPAVGRSVVGLDDAPLFSYHLMTLPDEGDEASGEWQAFADAGSVMPILKPLRTDARGDLEVTMNAAVLDTMLDKPHTPTASAADRWRKTDDGWIGKHFSAKDVLWFDGECTDGLLTARIAMTRGLRAGLALRGGLTVMLDHALGCIEWSTLDADHPIDRRRWQPRGGYVDLTVIAHGPSVEIHVDGKLMLHQVRYRETAGRLGLIVDNAEARFADVRCRAMKADIPLLTHANSH